MQRKITSPSVGGSSTNLSHSLILDLHNYRVKNHMEKMGHVYPLWPCPEGAEGREQIAEIIRAVQ